jgi:hypothetical protein
LNLRGGEGNVKGCGRRPHQVRVSSMQDNRGAHIKLGKGIESEGYVRFYRYMLSLFLKRSGLA